MDGILSTFSAKIVSFSIDPGYVEAASTNPTYILWEYIRNFSDILLIIALLVVIVSQLTGYGIDNYGIKKMLPKLIMNIVLINFSFFICQVFVDLSNLIGSGIKEMLESAAAAVAGGTDVSGGVLFGGILKIIFAKAAGKTLAGGAVIGAAALVIKLKAAIEAAGGLSAFLSGGVTAIGGPWVVAMILIPIVIALLAALVGIIIFFVLMASRELIVVACVALSPLAFLCLMFPNTEKLYKKWFNLFKAILILYPICGFLRGTSYVLTALIMNSNVEISLMQLFVALLCRYLPLILAPMLVKRSMGAISRFADGVKAKAKNMGNRAQSLAKNTNAYKNAQSMGKKGISEQRLKMNTKNLDDMVKNGNYKGKDGKKITSFEDLLKNPEQRDKFLKEHNDFKTRNAILQNKNDKEFLENFESGIAAGAYATPGLVAAAGEKAWFGAEKNFNDEMNWEKDAMQEVEEDPEDDDDYAKDASGNPIYEKDKDGSDRRDPKTGELVRAKKSAYKNPKDGKWYDSHTNREITDENRIKKLENIQRGIPNKELPNKYNLNGIVGGPEAQKRGDGKWVYANAGDRNGQELSMDDLEKVEKMVEEDKRKALGGRVNNYISDGKGDYVDRFGNSLGSRIGASALGARQAAGAYQSYADLMRAQAASQRASELNRLVGGYAGQSSEELARASGIIAHDDGLSATNAMLGKANVIESRTKMGYETATSQLAGAIASEAAIDKTISGNIAAMGQAQISIDAEAKRRVGLNLKQHVLDEVGETKINNLYDTAIGTDNIKNLQKIATNTTGTYSRYEQAIAQGILNQTNNGENLEGLDKAKIKELVEGRVIPSMTSELSITAEQQNAITTAIEAGRLQEDVIANPTASKDMKSVAQTLISLKGKLSSDPATAYDQAVKITNVDDYVASTTGNGFSDRIAQQTANIQYDYDTGDLSRIAMSGLSAAQVADKISAGATQATNQFKTSLAQNAAGEVELDLDVEQAKQDNRKIDVQMAQNAYSGNIDKLKVKANPIAEENARKNATTRVFQEAAKNIAPAAEPDFNVIIAGETERQKSRRIEDIKNALLGATGYKIGDIDINYGDLTKLKQAYINLIENGSANDQDVLLAVQGALAARGDPGVEALFEGFTDHNFKSEELFNAAKNGVISNPKNKAADVAFYKALQDYKWAATTRVVPDYKRSQASQKTEYAGKMTDKAFSTVFDPITADSAVALMARDVFDSKDTFSSLKEDRKKIIRQIVDSYDWSDPSNPIKRTP